jgi:hypothetical protein
MDPGGEPGRPDPGSGERLLQQIAALAAQLEELRATAEALHERERSSAALHEELAEARAAIEARDALLADLRDELGTSLRAEAERLRALDELRERSAALEDEPPPPIPEPGPAAADPDADPATDPADAADQRPARRFERRPPWPKDLAELPRAEIEWHAGYVNSYFRAVLYPAGRRRGTEIATGATFKWLLMAEPDAGVPEFAAEVERLAEALERAGWEPAGEGGTWFARRYAWLRQTNPPERLALRPLRDGGAA